MATIITTKIMKAYIPYVMEPDFRSYGAAMVCCREANNFARQILCANYIPNSSKTRCVFNKIGLEYVCDVSSESYDNIVHYNKERRK